jgi:hypothetical protein
VLVTDSALVNVMELGFEAVNGKGLVAVFSVAGYRHDTCSKAFELFKRIAEKLGSLFRPVLSEDDPHCSDIEHRENQMGALWRWARPGPMRCG